MIIRICAVAGFVPIIAQEVAQIYTAFGLASSGAGIVFVPESVQRIRLENGTLPTSHCAGACQKQKCRLRGNSNIRLRCRRRSSIPQRAQFAKRFL